MCRQSSFISCRWCQSFATWWEIPHTFMYMFRLDRRKSGENTCVLQCCHVPFSRFLAYPTTTASFRRTFFPWGFTPVYSRGSTLPYCIIIGQIMATIGIEYGPKVCPEQFEIFVLGEISKLSVTFRTTAKMIRVGDFNCNMLKPNERGWKKLQSINYSNIHQCIHSFIHICSPNSTKITIINHT